MLYYTGLEIKFPRIKIWGEVVVSLLLAQGAMVGINYYASIIFGVINIFAIIILYRDVNKKFLTIFLNKFTGRGK